MKELYMFNEQGLFKKLIEKHDVCGFYKRFSKLLSFFHQNYSGEFEGIRRLCKE